MALRDNNEIGSMDNTDAASAGNNDYQPQLRRRSRAARRVVEDPSDQDEEDTITVDNDIDIDIHPNSDADSHAEIHDNTSNKATAAPQKIVEHNKESDLPAGTTFRGRKGVQASWRDQSATV